MTQEGIRDGNKLIAEFMELKVATKQVMFDNRIYYETPFLQVNYAACEEQFAFHDEWNWLMPVLAKIQKLDHVCVIYGNYCNIIEKELFTKKYDGEGFDVDYYSDSVDNVIEAVYKCVVEFINYYK